MSGSHSPLYEVSDSLGLPKPIGLHPLLLLYSLARLTGPCGIDARLSLAGPSSFSDAY
jgi:hypothetical protein